MVIITHTHIHIPAHHHLASHLQRKPTSNANQPAKQTKQQIRSTNEANQPAKETNQQSKPTSDASQPTTQTN